MKKAFNNRSFLQYGKRSSLFALIALLIALLPTMGCKKWLDVTPIDKVPQKVLFSNEQGFKDALIGVYLNMDKSNAGGSYGLYSNHLSMGMLSVLAYAYDNGNVAGVGGGIGPLCNAAYSYSYNDAVMAAELTNIWKALYNNIANINNILEQIDSKKDLFSGNNYALIKGEALGLRAMMHFDALRMWGQSPAVDPNQKAIPYVIKMGVATTPLSTVNEAADLCLADLREARTLLAGTDTTVIRKDHTEPFLAYTQNHLNYWATSGLLARVHLYRGNTDSAAWYASAVISSGKFPLISSDVAFINNPVRDRTYSQEHLFSLYTANLFSYNNTIFNNTIPLWLTDAGRTKVYATPGADATDWRLRSWFDANSTPNRTVVPSKFFQDNNLPYSLQGLIPLVRVSEMYYIASEAANTHGNIPEAISYLNKVRVARGLKEFNASGINSTDSVATNIMKEYKKEFIQEGQTWFYYKRLNKDLRQASGTPATIPQNVYVFPLPDLEKEYRNG